METIYIIVGAVVGAVLLVLIAAVCFAIIVVGKHRYLKRKEIAEQEQRNGMLNEKNVAMTDFFLYLLQKADLWIASFLIRVFPAGTAAVLL